MLVFIPLKVTIIFGLSSDTVFFLLAGPMPEKAWDCDFTAGQDFLDGGIRLNIR